MRDMTGKRALVTGASSGIGRATAIRFARAGMDVAILGRDEARLRETARAIEACGAKCLPYRADSTDADAVMRCVRGAYDALGGLDAVFLNAGVYLRKEAAHLRMDEIRAVMETNFFGTLNALYAALPMLNAGSSVVVTSSMDGKKGVPPDAAYVASKFALNGFFQVLRQEMRPHGVHVAILYPSRTDTPQIQNIECPRATPKASAEKVAEAVLTCVRRRKKEVMVPYWPCKALVLAEAISSSLGDFLVRALRLGGTEKNGNAQDA